MSKKGPLLRVTMILMPLELKVTHIQVGKLSKSGEIKSKITTNRCQTMPSQSFWKLNVPSYYAKRVISLGTYIPFSKYDLLFPTTQFLISVQCYWVYIKCHKNEHLIGRNVLISYALKVKSILLKNIPLLQCHNIRWIKPQHACFPLVPRITQTNLCQKKLLSRLTKLAFSNISLLLAVGLNVIQQRNLRKEGFG